MAHQTTTSSKAPTSAGSSLQKLIEKKAYELFLKRGGSNGNDWSDWLEAERLVKKQNNIK